MSEWVRDWLSQCFECSAHAFYPILEITWWNWLSSTSPLNRRGSWGRWRWCVILKVTRVARGELGFEPWPSNSMGSSLTYAMQDANSYPVSFPFHPPFCTSVPLWWIPAVGSDSQAEPHLICTAHLSFDFCSEVLCPQQEVLPVPYTHLEESGR